MSILTYNELCELVEHGVITNVEPEQINGASIDLTLADGFYHESRAVEKNGVIILGDKQTPMMARAEGVLSLEPGGFALAATEQIFSLPNDIAALYVLKSSMARAGLNHLNAGFADPGWHGSALTMEFHNILRHHKLIMYPGDKCGQIILFRGEMVPEMQSYAVRGQYCGDKGVQQSRGMR